MTKLINIARQYCANWDAGKCVGCVFKKINNNLTCNVSSKLSGKNCSVDEGCDYFEAVVIPGIADERVRKAARLSRK